MADLFHDPDQMAAVLQRRAIRLIIPALKRLARVASGKDTFETDHQARACIALARLSPAYLGKKQADDAIEDDAPDTPLQELLHDRMDWLDSLTPEQERQRQLDREARMAEWQKTSPPYHLGIDAVTEYRRTHTVQHISEIQELDWPEHLRECTRLKKGENHE